MKILLLQLFWLSFAVIGLAEIFVYQRLKSDKQSKFIKFLNNTHPLSVLIIALGTGVASFVVVVAPAIFLELPIIFIECSYVAVLAASLLIVVKRRQLISLKLSQVKMPKTSRILLLLVIVTLVIDYRTSLSVGGLLTGDAKFELAQINLFAHKHLALTDPVFGNNGVPMTIYSVSILHAIQAMFSNFLNVSVPWIWFYSNAFYRFMIWISLFTLSWELLPKKIRREWSYAILVLLPFLFGSNFTYAELHNSIVFAWTALFIIGVKLWLESKSLFLLLIGSVLIATSHPLNSAMAIGFLILIFVVLLFMRLMTKARLVSLIPILLILSFPIGLYLYYPHGITGAGFNDTTTSGPILNLVHYGPFLLNSLRLPFSFLYLGIYILLTGYLLLAKRLSSNPLRILIFSLVICAICLYYNVVLISLIGYGYLIINAKNKWSRIVVVLLIIYLGVLIYNPILIPLIHNRLPLWGLSRFQDFNLLTFFASIIGMLCIVCLPLQKYEYSKLIKLSPLVVIALLIGIIPLFNPIDIGTVFGFSETPYQQNNRTQLQTLQTISQFKPQLTDQIVFSNDIDLASIPGVIITNVFSIGNESNANPGVNIGQRIACSQRLTQTLNASDLRQAGITAIITQSSTGSHFGKLLNDRPDITLIKQASGYRVYLVKEPEQTLVNIKSICDIPPTQK